MKHYHPQENNNGQNLLFYTVIKGKVGKMSQDNVASFLKRYGKMAKQKCPEVPDRVHAHIIRHYGEQNKMVSNSIFHCIYHIFLGITHHIFLSMTTK